MYDKVEFFRSYFARASEKQELIAEFQRRFGGRADMPTTILDLGCHDGTLMRKLMAAVGSELPAGAVITGVDPSTEAVQAFAVCQDLDSNIQLHVQAKTAEAFFDSLGSTEHYDWIIASHCLYWSKTLRQIMQQIVRRGDRVLIVLRGENGIYQIQSRFRHLLGNTNEQLYTAADIERVLIDSNVQFQRQDVQTTIEMPSRDSQQYLWLIAFFLQTSDDALSNDDLALIDQFLDELGNPLRHDVSFFWIGC